MTTMVMMSTTVAAPDTADKVAMTGEQLNAAQENEAHIGNELDKQPARTRLVHLSRTTQAKAKAI